MKPRAIVALLSFLALLSLHAAQPDTLVSPEVQANQRVTFRLRAPKAEEVTFFGDWMSIGAREPMTKDTNGVWSVTLGPLPPGLYIYTFTLDGLTMADPVNPRMKLRARTSASLLEIPGATPEWWEPREVPHGTVEIQWQRSTVIPGETRQIWVYKPPGYDEHARQRYPVLYLLHGSNDTPAGWTMAGCANLILDNLLAEKKCVPMIVVMPFGHAVPFTAPGEAQRNNTALMEEYLLKDVAPAIEQKYRVARGRENRAIVGLSMGGGHALHIGLSHLDQFSVVGAFSSAIPGDFDTRFKALLDDPRETNKKLKLLWIGCGRQDGAFERSQKLSERLTGRGINHTFRATEGGHTYTVWRQYLREIAPLLFQKNSARVKAAK